MPTYKTPGVYVEEISLFPPSVAEVETAIPAFIGYTEFAHKNADNDLILTPTKIYSLEDFERYYGLPEDDVIAVTVADDGQGGFTVGSFVEPTVNYLLSLSVKMFFKNGGGQCYIVSVGTYQTPAVISLTGDHGTDPATMFGLQDGLDAVKLEDEPTLIVIPEAVHLSGADYSTLTQAVLLQCNTLGDRFGIFDIRDDAAEVSETARDINHTFGNKYLKYAAAYYPFLKSTMNYRVNDEETNVAVTYGDNPAAELATFKTPGTTNAALYDFIKSVLKEHFVTVPPSGAVAGVYASIDRKRGVWKAPANVSLAGVIGPVVKFDMALQDAISRTSINAIRAFMGKGTLVWGARTLAGNDNEWRYVSVRRFFNMVEESLKKSTYWAVFEPNDPNTWGKVRGMIENYLTQKWHEGALAGATPKEAFFVKCGPGITMTSQDILAGKMNVEIGMAAVRPAEFIVLRFSHKMQ